VDLRYGASPRGSIALVRAAQAVAATYGRNFVTPDDVKEVAHPVLEHRLILTPDAELNQRRAEDIVNEILAVVPAPAASMPARA
jgi:MoxR-like ATPase